MASKQGVCVCVYVCHWSTVFRHSTNSLPLSPWSCFGFFSLHVWNALCIQTLFLLRTKASFQETAILLKGHSSLEDSEIVRHSLGRNSVFLFGITNPLQSAPGKVRTALLPNNPSLLFLQSCRLSKFCWDSLEICPDMQSNTLYGLLFLESLNIQGQGACWVKRRVLSSWFFKNLSIF